MTSVKSVPLKLGLVGYGNMGRALIQGVMQNPGLRERFSPIIFESWEPSAKAARDSGLEVAPSAAHLAAASDIVILAVKPNQVGGVLDEIAPSLAKEGSGKLVLSIAAGITLDFMQKRLGGRCPVARVMPNTLALVGEGYFALCFGDGVADPLRDAVRDLLKSLGSLAELEESKFNAFTALSGSGPAYVFHFMESLAEAGVSVGLDRATSRSIALSLVRGAAAMAERTGEHPAVLREQVSSPAGTTIAAINHLDRTGVRGHLVDAVIAATARGREMEEEA